VAKSGKLRFWALGVSAGGPVSGGSDGVATQRKVVMKQEKAQVIGKEGGNQCLLRPELGAGERKSFS